MNNAKIATQPCLLGGQVNEREMDREAKLGLPGLICGVVALLASVWRFCAHLHR